MALASLIVTMVLGLPAISASASSLPNTSTPTLSLNRTIRTTPFNNTPTLSMKDGEGSAFVPNNPGDPSDDSLWLADDDGKSVWEVNPYTGALKSHIGPTEWAATPEFTSAALPTVYNYKDIESMAYDAANDILYTFSGKCCTSSVIPTVYRLKRGGDGTFHPDTWRALPAGSDFTASAWNPADHMVWVGVSKDFRTYDYATNVAGAITHVAYGTSQLSAILGMSFSTDGSELYVVGGGTKLFRVNWTTKSVVPGWAFTLSNLNVGMLDSRAVELIPNTIPGTFDQFYVLDGYDGRSSGDPLKHAVFVFDVLCSNCAPVAPTASFTWSQTASPANTIQFTNTSTGSPTPTYLWDFGDGSTSAATSPSHTYAGAGPYSVTLTASNGVRPDGTSTQQVTVTPPVAPTASFTWSQPASPANTIHFTNTSTGSPTPTYLWDFGDGSTSTATSPSHTYAGAGPYSVTLTASNGTPPDGSSTQQVTVTVTTQLTFTPVADTYISWAAQTTNYGTSTIVKGAYELNVKEYRPYLAFDVELPPGATVTSATLRLYVTDPGPGGGSWYAMQSPWIESGTGSITWANAPTIESEGGSPFYTASAAVTAGQWLEIPVPASVVKANAIDRFAAKSFPGSNSVYFSSKEGSQPPQLVVNFS